MNYMEWQRSRGRRGAVVAGVIVFHVLVIYFVGSWKGWLPKRVEGLINVTIVADAKPNAPGTRHGASAAKPLPLPRE